MLKIITFLFELSVIIFIERNIFHMSASVSKPRQGISAALFLLWLPYIYFSTLPLPNTFIIILVSLILFCEHWYVTLCSVFACSLVINIATTVVLHLYCIFTNSIHENSSLAYTLNCITLAGIFAVSFIISKKTSDDIRTFLSINRRGYALLFLVIVVDFILSSVSDLLFYVNLNQKGRYLLVLAIFVIIAMSIVLLILYFRLKHDHYALQQTNSINLKMLQMEERHYKELQKKNADLRAFRHDYNYHITAMQGLSQKKDLTELKKYVESLIAVKEQVYYFSTNHPVADAIINSIYENIPENTDFHVDGKFPETIFVNNSDLCILLSNLLKNAVEAVSRLSAEQKKQIYLSLFGNDDYIIIRIENTSEQQPSHRITSKPDSINHGFGLKNVRDAVNRYGGKLDLKYSHGIFTASAYMRNTSAVKV